jgi:fatty acid desaturase/predicted heme/steroid binding protein
MTKGPKNVSPMSASGSTAGATKLPGFTWEEVAAHNCEATGIWISVDDFVYEIPTSFLAQHPGGKEYILLAAGRDATDLMASYHPFTRKPFTLLERFKIGTLTSRQYPKFKPDNGFYATMCARVAAHFKAQKQDDKDPLPAIVRMSLMSVVYVAAYFGCMTGLWAAPIEAAVGETGALAVKLLCAVLLGWSQVMFLLHVMHDCSHSSVGHTEAGWKLGGRMFSETIVGSSMVCWQNQHVVGHHIYTNVYSIDPDLPVARDGDVRLIAPQQNLAWLYRYQHIYLFPLYGLFTFKSRVQDIQIYLERLNGPIAVNPVTASQWARLAGSKLIYLFLRVAVPLALVPSWREWALLGFVAEFVSGLYLALNFQVSHVSTAAEFPVAALIPASPSFPCDVDKTKRNDPSHVHGFSSSELANEKGVNGDKTTMSQLAAQDKTNMRYMWDMGWAELQCRTSVDYAHESKVCTFMCGALNYQTEHHLFPTVSQYLYPEIAPIVQQTCKEFGVRYNYIGTFGQALQGHVDHLREMGQKGIPCYPKMD